MTNGHVYIVMRRDGRVCEDGEWRPKGEWYVDNVYENHWEANSRKNQLLYENYEPYFNNHEIRVEVKAKQLAQFKKAKKKEAGTS